MPPRQPLPASAEPPPLELPLDLQFNVLSRLTEFDSDSPRQNARMLAVLRLNEVSLPGGRR